MDEPLTTTGLPRRRTKFWVGGSVIVAVLAVLLVWGMARPGAATTYMTPSEVSRFVVIGGEVRMNGTVVPGSIERDGLTTSFLVTDGDAEVQVTTESPMPDAFMDSSEVVAIGTFDGDTFAAGNVLAKCPSKFKAKV